MTGFSRAECTTPERKITVEVRSLNSKQLDLSTRIPNIYRERETQIRTLAAKTIERGKSDITISYQNIGTPTQGTVNQTLFVNYYNELEELLRKVGRDANQEHLLGAILRMPDVIGTQTTEVNDTELDMLMKTVDDALTNFDNFRRSEGKVLMNDLLERIETIRNLGAQIPQYETQRIDAVKARLYENLEKLKIEVDRNRLEQELIYYLEKFDITEEKVRLTRHLDYFEEIAATPAAGRKLGFIAQEIGREINTTGSKANQADLQKIVVTMKDELEKIKEQLLNIL